MHTDHVPGCSTDCLQGNHPCRAAANIFTNTVLEEGKHHVADCITAGNKCTQSTDKCGKDRIQLTAQIGSGFSEDERHFLIACCAAIRVQKDLHHWHRKNKCCTGCNHVFARIFPAGGKFVWLHAMHKVCQHSDNDENESG